MKPNLAWYLYGAGAACTIASLWLSAGLTAGLGAAGGFLLFAALCATPTRVSYGPDREATRPPAVVRPSGNHWRQP